MTHDFRLGIVVGNSDIEDTETSRAKRWLKICSWVYAIPTIFLLAVLLLGYKESPSSLIFYEVCRGAFIPYGPLLLGCLLFKKEKYKEAVYCSFLPWIACALLSDFLLIIPIILCIAVVIGSFLDLFNGEFRFCSGQLILPLLAVTPFVLSLGPPLSWHMYSQSKYKESIGIGILSMVYLGNALFFLWGSYFGTGFVVEHP